MIIKYTFKNNDFTQVIEKYLEEYGPFYAFNYTGMLDVRVFRHLVKQYDEYNDKYVEDKEITKDEYINIKGQLLGILKANFIQYINNIKPNSRWHTEGINAEELQNCKEYIFKNIKISLVKSIPDQWENDEVVYYITSQMKYITM